MMFAVVYEVVLREAKKRGWKILAYADDVAIGVNTDYDYRQAIAWLSTWKGNVNLKINTNKTKEMRLGKMTGYKGIFEVVKEFKYLGVSIYEKFRARRWRTRLMKQVEEYIVKAERAKYTNVGANRIAWIWWAVSKILYAAISYVVLRYAQVKKVAKIAIQAARKTYGIGRGNSTEFAKDFMNLRIEERLYIMAEKLRRKLGESLCLREKEKE